MENAIEAEIAKQMAQRFTVGEVAHDQRRVAVDGFAVALLQIIKDHHAMTAREEIHDNVTTDISGTAGDEVCPGTCESPACEV